MSEALSLAGELEGHNGWVTAIAATAEDPTLLVSASRDKTCIVWKLERDGDKLGIAQRSLHGHNHFVSDVVISHDGDFALSGSWDGTLRLWDLKTGKTEHRFTKDGHTKDVLSVAFSVDNRLIVSGSRDKSIKIWNTLADCKYTLGGTRDCHTDWVSCVRFSPSGAVPLVVSCGWDKLVKVWLLKPPALKTDLVGHTGYLNTVTVSPDGSLCASGGQDGIAMLWDLNEGRRLYSLEADATINALVFSPNRYWLCAATNKGIKIWDLESKGIVDDLRPDFYDGAPAPPKAVTPYCVSLCWSADGSTLYSGYTDKKIRVWHVGMA